MRLFASLELPETTRAACADVLRRLRAASGSVRILPVEAMHLTLAFLGEVEAARVDAVRVALAKVARSSPPVPLHVAGAGAFPDLARPRVLWLGVNDAAGAVAALAGAVQTALAPLGFEPEARGFRPHLTVARLRDGRLPPALRTAVAAAATFDAGRAQAGVLALMESRLDPAGAKYRTVDLWTLSGA